MSADRRGNTVYEVGSNKAPFYIDGGMGWNGTDNTGLTLLAGAATSAVVNVTDFNHNIWIAGSIAIFNNSGQDCQIVLTVPRQSNHVGSAGGNGYNTVEFSTINVAAGSTMSLPVRVESFTVKNLGGSIQTGFGVQVVCALEPSI